jgi:CRISPR-associated endonuclease Csn1
LNNKILVNSVDNEKKGDSYPIAPYIQDNMRGYWANLHKIGLIGDEKYKRLTRTTPFTEDEKYEFINRQLVETRQSTKAVASLLKELYPDTEIVYVKAELASDFRRNFKQRRFGDENYQEFDLPKARSLNDLHHAKDAYLNIVVGNVWYHKFNKRYYLKDADNNQKPEIIFTRTLKIKDDIIWDGIHDKERVVKIARKNNAHMTMYSYCKHSGQNGGFFDQNPKSAKKGLISLKKDMPTEIYGGYDSATVSGFALARYTLGKKVEVSFVPVKLLDLKKFVEDDSFAKEYVFRELGEKAINIEILLNKRIIKIFTMISLDGARFCIRGKSGLSDI